MACEDIGFNNHIVESIQAYSGDYEADIYDQAQMLKNEFTTHGIIVCHLDLDKVREDLCK